MPAPKQMTPRLEALLAELKEAGGVHGHEVTRVQWSLSGPHRTRGVNELLRMGKLEAAYIGDGVHVARPVEDTTQ